MLNKLKNKRLVFSALASLVLILVLICSFILFFEVNDYDKYKEEKQDLYYYYFDKRYDFKSKIVLNAKNVIMSVERDEETLRNIPLYYKNSNAMVFSENLEIVYPYKNSPIKKLGKYSKIYYMNDHLYVNSEAGIGRLYDCFLYDGIDTYIFIEDTYVIINNQRYDLSPMSYVTVTGSGVKIYDKSTDKYTAINEVVTSAAAYTENYYIDLKNDTVTSDDSYYLLIKNVDGLEFNEF